MKTGLIARMDKSGLGQGQTLRLARLLKPDKLMVIDSTSFNGSKQYPEWYKDYDRTTIYGFPTNDQIAYFCKEVDILISAETFYSDYFTRIAAANNVKTILIFNYEFNDYLSKPYLKLPDKMVQPSYWHLDEMQKKYDAIYLPTPIFEDEFIKARETNLKRTGKPRYLFLNGKTAAHDRAGLESLYEALQLSKGDFEIVVKAQGDVKKHPDPRLSYDFSNPEEQYKLYEDFDAMIHPRRYGGQSLPMCEALMCGLPVIMTDISPNNEVLYHEWLVEAKITGIFMARTNINIYSADPQALANKLDNLDVSLVAKNTALNLSAEYDAENLREQYKELVK